MQSRLLAVPAARRQKAGQTKLRARSRRLQPLRHAAQGNRLDFAFDAPPAAGFELFRLVPDQAFADRHAGRRETQRLALDQGSGQLDAIQRSLDNQAAGCPAASPAAGSRTSSIDFDFSSFIIGDGEVTARLVRIVR